jgi:TolA-binding protein
MLRPSASLTLVMVCVLAACASKRGGTPDNEPTLKTLASRSIKVEKDQGVVANEEQAIEAYKQFLKVAPNAPQRAEAMRRIGDLEMDSADNKSADATPAVTPAASGASAGGVVAGGPDYRVAIARYQEFLKTYPKDPANDKVLYQLSRAYEQGGQPELALKTLDRLVKDYPGTKVLEEAQFRRGELLFSNRDYVTSEKAYAVVLEAGESSQYHDRALYMHGWSLFKQGRLDDAMQSFFGVLDAKLGGREEQDDKDDVDTAEGDGVKGDGAKSTNYASLENLEGLTRADRELVEDTFRVISISLANLQGAESIPNYINSPDRKVYEFRVYEQLAELYLKQERVKDAADTLGLFARRNPLHAQAPVLQARVIEIYEHNNFGTLALDAKREYVGHYGSKSEFRTANPKGWERAQPLVKTHVVELARHFHATAQKSKNTADYQEAVRWYREYLASFPNDPQAAQNNFLLAELLFEDKRFKEASVEYEKTAYGYPKHDKSADAGYAALLGYLQQQKTAPPSEVPALQRESVASALRFADAFPSDNRAGPVLSDAAEKLYVLHDADKAAVVAQRVLDLKPPAAEPQRRVAWTVIAHTSFEKGTFDQSEKAYAEVLKLTPEKDAARNDLVERQAASIYKQGEQARAAGKSREAVDNLLRVAAVPPQSTVRATAQYDAAASMIAMKDWDGSIRTLEDFRQRFPNHPLQSDVSSKLAVAYIEKGQWAGAAGEFERLAATNKDPKVARDAQWQAAEFYEKGGARPSAAKAYERYLAQYPQPLEPAVEARYRLSKIAREDGNTTRADSLMREIFLADQNGGAARTDRTRYLGATAALEMAEPVAADYRKVALVEPLQKQLKLKKSKMEETLKAYQVAANYGVADVTTAATYRIAVVYRDFGKALMTSERPKKLTKVEAEQYNVLLEEQAFPFEEKATELHEVNARRAASGIYDKWVKSSFDALRELRPVRYGKNERSEGVVDAIR